ncbi:MAG: acyl-CoA desaturase [Saprospiraceae bacterium]|nr:acyl-CoA desaturase [Saprospiraceae bacterium]
MKKPMIRYKNEGPFFIALRREVKSYFSALRINKFANLNWYIKAVLLGILYMSTYAFMLIWGDNAGAVLIAYGILGALTIIIGLNIGHDAAHMAISPNKGVNNFFLKVFDVLGTSSKVWRMRHVYGHHPFPNVIHFDEDIAQSRLLRIFPKDKMEWFHKYQHLYAPIIMVLVYTLNWMFIRDFVDSKRKMIGTRKVNRSTKVGVLRLLFNKLFFLIFILGIPIWMHGHIGQFLLGYLIMHICSGLVVSVALVSAHIGDYQEFPVPDEDGLLPYSWGEHQLATTSDFCTDSWVFNSLFGGFNHHVIHHLFPNVNHIHYPALTQILRDTAKRFGIPYHCEQNLLKVFTSHFNLLKNQGFHAWQQEFDI